MVALPAPGSAAGKSVGGHSCPPPPSLPPPLLPPGILGLGALSGSCMYGMLTISLSSASRTLQLSPSLCSRLSIRPRSSPFLNHQQNDSAMLLVISCGLPPGVAGPLGAPHSLPRGRPPPLRHPNLRPVSADQAGLLLPSGGGGGCPAHHLACWISLCLRN